MSDNLKVAKECGIAVGICGDSSTRRKLEAYTSRILASQQAAHDAEIAKLKEEMVECEQRGAVNGLKKFRSDYRLDKIYPSEFLNEAIDRAEAELRATSKKAG